MRSIRVRLKVDLTRYSRFLVVGAEGLTSGDGGFWSRASDRFVSVIFPSAGRFDILWDSLEIIDPGYLEEQAASKLDRQEALRSARNVVRVVGPRGGFRYLSFEFTGSDGIVRHDSTTFKASAEELIDLFGQYGIPIEQRRE